MRSVYDRRSRARSGAGWVFRSDSVVVSSGFRVFVFMALACVRGAGGHIGEVPGATLILYWGTGGQLRDDPDTQIRARRAMMGSVEEPEPWHRGPFGAAAPRPRRAAAP